MRVCGLAEETVKWQMTFELDTSRRQSGGEAEPFRNAPPAKVSIGKCSLTALAPSYRDP